MTHHIWTWSLILTGILLTVNRSQAQTPPKPLFDMAPFGRVVTSDPQRMQGTLADRVDIIPAEDIYLETDLAPQSDGVYQVPDSGSIGLVWMESRCLSRLELDVRQIAPDQAAQTRLERWEGATLWQGKWVPLPAKLTIEGDRWNYDLTTHAGDQATTVTRKIRWVLPASETFRYVTRLAAFTPCQTESVKIRLECESPGDKKAGQVEVYNGHLIASAAAEESRVCAWDLSQPLHLEIERAVPTPENQQSKMDQTRLELRLPDAAICIALPDLLENGPVYVPSAGVFASVEPTTLTLEQYRQQIAGQKTILEEVRSMPEQTMQQAFDHLYQDTQNYSPTMLSLAADNAKFILYRNSKLEHNAFGFSPGHSRLPLTWRQDYGVLGVDECAHLPGSQATALRIKDQTFEKGLGSHANGMIDLKLDGAFETFQASVGAHWNGGNNPSSVVFSVLVDGQEVFQSPVMGEADAALPISIPVTGARQLQLKVGDAGNGINFDGANWAQARLYKPGQTEPVYLSDMIATDPAIERSLEGGWLPAPRITHAFKGVDYTRRAYVVPFDQAQQNHPLAWLNSQPLCVWEFSFANTQSSPLDVFENLTFKQNTENGTLARLRAVEGGVVVTDDQDKLLALVVTDRLPKNIHAQVADGAITFQGTLPAGEVAHGTVYVPGWDLKGDEYRALISSRDLFAEFQSYWENLMAPATQIDLPDPLLNNIIRASQVHCMLAARNENDGQEIAPWISSTCYGPLASEANSIIRGMMLLGQEEFARRGLDYYIARYKDRHLTMGYTLISTGWHLQTLGRYWKLYHNRPWLEQAAPKVAEVDQWILDQRQKTMQPAGQGRPEYGLVPPGLIADWTNFAYYFCLNGYYYSGLWNSAQALEDIDYPGAAEFVKQAEAFGGDILRAYETTQARTPVRPLRNGTWAAGNPTSVHTPGLIGDYFANEDSNRSWCYDIELGAHQLIPQGVLAADNPQAEAILNIHEDIDFLETAWLSPFTRERNHADWFNLGGFSKVQPYYTRNAEIYALRDDIKPFIRSYFNTFPSLVNLEDLSFWEHLNATAAWNKTHETGYFLQQTRFMLVQERGEQLWLAPFVTTAWLGDGQTIRVQNAPTRFGAVSYQIDSHLDDGFILVHIEGDWRTAPEQLVVRLRHPQGKLIRKVKVNGKRTKDFDTEQSIIRLSPEQMPLDLKVIF